MIKYAEFCAGIGGFSVGIQSSDIPSTCVYANEINANCEKTYHLNFGKNFDSYDVFQISPSNLPDFDVLCSGFPCQPFSIAGKKEGFHDTRGQIIFKIIEILSAKKPKVVFLENVSNIINHENGNTINIIEKLIKDEGYNVYTEVLNSKYFGVPQSRPRCYIVGIRCDINKPFAFPKGNYDYKTIREILNPNDYSIKISDKWNLYIDLFLGIKNEKDIPFDIPKTRKQLERVSENCDLTDCVLQIRSSGIRAYSLDSQFPTFAVSVSGGGAMIPVLTKERRHLSIIEMQRLMGFPDYFTFNVSRTECIKQLSNAVCPPVICEIYKAICKII